MTRRRGFDISAATLTDSERLAIAKVQAKHGIKPKTAAKENAYYTWAAKERRRVIFARQNGSPLGSPQQRPPKPKRKAGMQDMGGIMAAIVKDVTGGGGELD